MVLLTWGPPDPMGSDLINVDSEISSKCIGIDLFALTRAILS